MGNSSFNKIVKNIKQEEINKFIKRNMQLKYLVDGAEALGQLMQIKMPIVLSFKLSLFIKKINPAVEEFGKKRNELLAIHAEKILDKDKKETGQMKFTDKEKAEEFTKEINLLLDTEVKVEVPEIKIEEFGNIEIEPKLLMNLDWLVKM